METKKASSKKKTFWAIGMSIAASAGWVGVTALLIHFTTVPWWTHLATGLVPLTTTAIAIGFASWALGRIRQPDLPHHTPREIAFGAAGELAMVMIFSIIPVFGLAIAALQAPQAFGGKIGGGTTSHGPGIYSTRPEYALGPYSWLIALWLIAHTLAFSGAALIVGSHVLEAI